MAFSSVAIHQSCNEPILAPHFPNILCTRRKSNKANSLPLTFFDRCFALQRGATSAPRNDGPPVDRMDIESRDSEEDPALKDFAQRLKFHLRRRILNREHGSSLTNNKIMIVNLRATIIEITHSRESSLKKIVELETQMTTLRLSGSREQAFDHQLLIRAEETLTTVRLQADSLLGSSRTAVRAMNAAFSAVEIVEEDSTVPEEA